MTKKPPGNLQEFVREYLFDREVELLKKETEIQKLQSDLTKITKNIRRLKTEYIEPSGLVGLCDNCFTLIFDHRPSSVVEHRVDCWSCNGEDVEVCIECSKICGGTMMELPHLEEHWVCEECYEKPIPSGVVSYCKIGKNSERSPRTSVYF